MSKSHKARHTQFPAPSKLAMPSFILSSGTQEALKWLAVVLMTIDHVNRYLLHDSVSSMYALGRLAMPIFAFTLAYNLAQPGAFAKGVYFRVIRRLAVFAAISSIPFIALNVLIQGWWPLNILFALLTGTGMVALLESDIKYRNALAFLLFIIGGSVVEYWWAGLAVFYFSWRYVRSPNLFNLAGLVLAMFLLGNINGNQWALITLPVIFAATYLKINIPRIKHVLYVYYPLHLICIWVVARFYIFSQ